MSELNFSFSLEGFLHESVVVEFVFSSVLYFNFRMTTDNVRIFLELSF